MNYIKSKNIESGKSNLLIICSLFLIMISSFILRMNYFSFESPTSSDAFLFFFYSAQIATLENLPINYAPANPGWSWFLAVFFSIFDLEKVIEYMQIQKILTVLISVITIIPVYYFCKKFFDYKFSILGAIIFAFEPHLIQSSLFGNTDPIYIFLLATSLALFFNSNKKFVFISFAVVGISTIVRSEGLFLFFALLTIFLIQNRKNKKELKNIVICILIFCIFVIPVSLWEQEVNGKDAIFSRVGDGLVEISGGKSNQESSRIFTAIENFPKYFGWSLIPLFLLFLPIGTWLLLKNWNSKSLVFMIIGFFLILPMLWAYSYPLRDIRYVSFLFPVLVVVSLFGIQYLDTFTNKKKIFICILAISLVVSSIGYLEWKVIKPQEENNQFEIAQILVKSAKGVNSYYPEEKLLISAEIPSKWSDLEMIIKNDESKTAKQFSVDRKIVVFDVNEYNSLEKFIKNSGEQLTHLVVDDNEERPEFLKNIYHNGEKINFLTKEFDSKENNFIYNVKIFKIDHELFNSLNNYSLDK